MPQERRISQRRELFSQGIHTARRPFFSKNLILKKRLNTAQNSLIFILFEWLQAIKITHLLKKNGLEITCGI